MKITEKNISELRVWLNEDRITDLGKLVSNEDIKFWLDMIKGEEYVKSKGKEIKEQTEFGIQIKI